MLYTNNSFDSLIILFVYMFIYNLSLVSIFWTLHQFNSFKLSTIFSFSDLKFNFYFVTLITLALFSMAGVPPFVGFFSKLLILLMLSNSNFFFFYIFFFGLLFLGLYFYLQNIRFLYSSNSNKINYSYSNNIRLSTLYFNYTFLIIFFFCFGLFFFDDILLFFFWIFS